MTGSTNPVGSRLMRIASDARKRQDESATMFGIMVGFIVICLIPFLYSFILQHFGVLNSDNTVQVIGMLACLLGGTWFLTSRFTALLQAGREDMYARVTGEIDGSDVQMLAMEEETWLRLRELNHAGWLYRLVVPDLPMTPSQQIQAAAVMHPALLRMARGEHAGVASSSRWCVLTGLMAKLWVNDCMGCLVFPLLPFIIIGSPVVLPLAWACYRCQMRINVTLIEYCGLYD